MNRKEIPKDKDGLFVNDGTMYNELPIYVFNEDDGTQELVDKENWIDWLSDFNKERYKFYMKGGEK